MNKRKVLRELLSMGLAAALFLCPATTALAVEITEETFPAETADEMVPEETEAVIPAETAPPGEVSAPAEPTLPPTEETAPTTEATVPEETDAPAEPVVPVETTEPSVPGETQPPETLPAVETTTPSEPLSPVVLTVSQVLDLASDTRDLTFRGTVVYALGVQAVLQDSTGGIRLSFPEDPGIAPGQILQVTGRRSAGLFVSEFELLGTGDLPAVETTLPEAPENLRVVIRGAEAFGGYLHKQGLSLSLAGDLPQGQADRKVDVYGVILDGRFYADAIVPETSAVSAENPSGSDDADWNLYFGLLHAHTDTLKEGFSPRDAFRTAASLPQMDFFAITNDSTSFDDSFRGSINEPGEEISRAWKEGREAASWATTEDFVALFGYEMSWPEDKGIGHIATFHTPGWQTWKQQGFKKLTNYYDALGEAAESVSQFNHPGPVYGDFQRFANCTPEYDQRMHLIEVGIAEGAALKEDYYQAYTMALDKGWHLAPSHNQDILSDDRESTGDVRTVILAKELSDAAIFDAIRNYRVYATEDRDLEIRYTFNGAQMGSILGPTEEPVIQVVLQDPTDGVAGTVVEVIVDGGMVAETAECGADGVLTIPMRKTWSYHYLRIRQPDEDVAVTAPVWVTSYDGIDAVFSSENDYPEEGDSVTLTLDLYNGEWSDFVLEKIEFFENGQILHTMDQSEEIPGLKNYPYEYVHTRADAGESKVTVRATGSIHGYPKVIEKSVILHYQPKEPLVTTIASARSGVPGLAYHIEGYVTAGNQNPYNTFSDALYVQDDTGGIAVTGAVPSGFSVGSAVSVIGVLRKQGGNLVLDATKTIPLEKEAFRFSPRNLSNSATVDYAANGGMLIQVEGTLVSLTKEGKGVSRFTLRDLRGDLVTVVIDDNIRSGAYGTNELAGILKKGRTIRAIGLLHVDEFQQSVLRVRNCDEVVYVAPRFVPKADPTNPKTGDRFWFLYQKSILYRLPASKNVSIFERLLRKSLQVFSW